MGFVKESRLTGVGLGCQRYRGAVPLFIQPLGDSADKVCISLPVLRRYIFKIDVQSAVALFSQSRQQFFNQPLLRLRIPKQCAGQPVVEPSVRSQGG